MSSRVRSKTGQRPAIKSSAAHMSESRAARGIIAESMGPSGVGKGTTFEGIFRLVDAQSCTCLWRQRILIAASRLRIKISDGLIRLSRWAYHNRFIVPRQLPTPQSRLPSPHSSPKLVLCGDWSNSARPQTCRPLSQSAILGKSAWGRPPLQPQ